MRFLPMLVDMSHTEPPLGSLLRMVGRDFGPGGHSRSEGTCGMRKVRMGGHTLELYDSVNDLPIGRFHDYNRSLMLDAGIGGDMEAVDAHMAKIVAFLKAGKTDLAAGEMENLRQGLWLVMNGMTPRHSAFASLIASVDGKSTDGWTDSQLDALLKELPDIPVGELVKELDGVKKKIDAELELYFPEVFGKKPTEWYVSLKRMAMAVLDGITEGLENEEEIKAEEGRLLNMMAPKKFDGSGGAEVKYDREFETMSLAMTQQLHVDVKGMTVLEYYNAYEYLREQGKKMKSIRRG